MRLDINSIIEKKKKNEKITMLTAYDFSYAAIVDAAEIDIILVGDSLANVVLGMESTTEISMDEMINHSRAVVKGSEKGLVVGDMPYVAYQDDKSSPVDNARRFVDEAGCQGVKLEWYDRVLEVTADIINAGIPVMGHIGFTPQTADKLGGSVVQGKDLEGARSLIEQAVKLEEIGCFSIVLECVPWQIAEIISKKLSIPTIGIGAGDKCDGQVLVLNDLLGLFKRFRPKFVRVYDDLFEKSVDVIKRFKEDVEKGTFPSLEESFSIKDEDFEKIKEKLQD
jgi:3-methyl-2-oxobutanoate hydroxymethyltransferase